MGQLGGRALASVLVIVIVVAVAVYFYYSPAQVKTTGQIIGVAATTTSCWSYTTNSTCSAFSNCVWKNDSWSQNGWCQELNCWSLYSQTDCTGTSISGKNCTWKPGTTTTYCEQLQCWGFSGTNQTACESNSQNLNCEWRGECYSSSYSPGVNCWGKSQSECQNATGCSWGQCYQQSCSGASSSATCNARKDYRGVNCTWDTTNNYCREKYCYNQGTNASRTLAQRQQDCETAAGINCEWKQSYCMEKDCYTWDNTNESACVSNPLGLSCYWSNSSGYGNCMQKGCGSYSVQECGNYSKCNVRSFISSGWCEEVQCWRWDGWNSGNQTACVNNPYGLSCAWSNWNSTGSNSTGSCYPVTTKSCANMTTERECMDTMYCWWQYTNPANPSAGGSCRDPGNFSAGTNTSIFNNWNPGCYVFDNNGTVCNATIGCAHNGTKCTVIPGHANAGAINTSGINCTMVNDTSICNSIGVLSSCCSWGSGGCATDRMTTSCWDQMQKKSESSCEDAKTKSRCEAVANYPWFMPCEWSGDNSTGSCKFKVADIFGSGSQSCVSVENKKSCEAAGCKWITENYCEGTVSVPTGRCEYKFDDEDNCDKACFACEKKDSNGATVNASNAKSACEGSALGKCEFVADATAALGGRCKSKDQFRKGFAQDCEKNCGDCTFMGSTLNNDTAKRPDYICNTRKADANGDKCKWDNSTQTCVKKSDKTCADSCDRCAAQADCQNIGRTAVANQSGSCKWQGDSNSGSCTFNIGQNVEICWDGIDNTNDTLTDCADPACYSDPFCGVVSGSCSGWLTNTTCIVNGCEWVTDNWGSWCDVKGGQCWKYNQNSSVCNLRSSCQWNNGTGSSWCEQDWSRSEICMGKNSTQCSSLSGQGCTWSLDTWCQGQGNSSSWCQSSGGGWCEYEAFKPKNCWTYNSGSSECGNHSGCSWRTDQYSQPHCETNMSANCWNYSSSGTCSAAGCWWRTDQWGSWCTTFTDKCWNSANATSCNAQVGSNGNAMCYWQTWSGGGGSCQPLCYNSSANTNSACNAISGCSWKSQSGWCEDAGMAACSNTSNYNSATNCTSTTGCRWKSPGWCEPKGGGFSASSTTGGGGSGGGTASECYRYDGNQTACTNSSKRSDNLNMSCGWTPEPSPRCDVNWGGSCWQQLNSTACTNAGCWWKSDAYGSSCMNIMDQCWTNQSLQSQTNCTANTLCTWSGWSCQPKCTSQNTSGDCTAGALSGKCKWVTGWCNPGGMTEMFNGMEAGAPMPLGQDQCGEVGMQASVDICGFGMKDMGDAYGFGMGVNDFGNASTCNKEKLSSFVMGMVGGGGGGPGGGTVFGQERTGTGNETVNFVVYIDTDGQTTGGCSLNHNTSAVGYEFMFKYSSVWNANTSKAVESFSAYKCEGSAWKAANIKLSAWKKLMCSEIGGPMIAVDKSDLAKHTTLYNSSKDMRVSVASFGNSGNATNPTDTAGPGWTTPGSIDFTINDLFSYGANTALFEDVLKKGFMQGEDCFNGIDDDKDGSTDCSDYDCQFMPVCSGKGVNAAGYSDTRAPQVTSVKIEEYPDAATIMYDTNKPTNGTVELYGADSRCTNRTDAIYDVGILKSSTVRQYKTWHETQIYNDGNPSDNISLNYPLASGVTYYYKLKVCDSNGKCAVSKCSNFTTPVSVSKCTYCNFVTRLKVPDGWEVYYDVDQDGTYEHWQGNVCGPNAGMKTNYTDGRKANIRLSKSDNSTYFEFINVSLTETGLNDKVRTISGSGAMIYDTTKKMVGLPAETRDKIINNLHPETCRVKIPSSGTCTKLYHCDDNGENCTDRTADAGGAPIDAAACVWLAPYCEFSTYKTTASSSTGGSTGGGGGGGGGGGSSASTIVVEEAQLAAGYTYDLGAKDKFRFIVASETHYVTVNSVSSTAVSVNVTSALQQATIGVGTSRSFELTGDSYYDMSVTVNSVNTTSSKASLTIKSVHELVPGGAAQPSGGTGDGSAGDGSGGTGGTPSAGGPMSTAPPMPGDVANKIIITLAVLIAAVVVVLVVYFAKRRRSA